MRKLIALFLLGLLALPTWAQTENHLSISAEIRPRYEGRTGYKELLADGEKSANFVSNRVRVNMLLHQQKFSMGLKLQDVGTWGDKSVFGQAGNHKIGFYEAWAAYQFLPQWSIKVGRQALAYDDERILGAINWAQTGLSHDAFLLKFNNKAHGFHIHLGATLNQEKEILSYTPYPYTNKSMQYVWMNHTKGNLYASFLLLNNGTQLLDKTAIRYSQTFGIYLNNMKKASWDIGGAAYMQTGKDVNNTDMEAFYLAAHAKKVFCKELKWGIGAEILSGTAADDKKNKSFDPLYGTNHKFNGFMDYFYVGSHKNSVGLQDYYTQVDYKKNKFSGSLAGHFFASMAEMGGGYDNYLGSELDLTLHYQVDSQFKITAGYSHLFASESMQLLKHGGSAGIKTGGDWLYLTLAFSPQIYSK